MTGRVCTLLLHATVFGVCITDLHNVRDKWVNQATVSIFIVGSVMAALAKNTFLPAEPRNHDLLHEGICGCVPSKGRLLRARTSFFLRASSVLLLLVVATRHRPASHCASTVLLLSAVFVVQWHLRNWERYVYALLSLPPSVAWVVHATMQWHDSI